MATSILDRSCLRDGKRAFGAGPKLRMGGAGEEEKCGDDRDQRVARTPSWSITLLRTRVSNEMLISNMCRSASVEPHSTLSYYAISECTP
jgi:hypothetical protein